MKQYCKNCKWLHDDGGLSIYCEMWQRNISEDMTRRPTMCEAYKERVRQEPRVQVEISKPKASKPKKERGLVDSTCKGCKYLAWLGWSSHTRCCDYILMEKSRARALLGRAARCTRQVRKGGFLQMIDSYKSKSIIAALACTGNFRGAPCGRDCPYWVEQHGGIDDFEVIGTCAAKRAAAAYIGELEAELADERYRHDRVQDFCVAQGEELAEYKRRLRAAIALLNGDENLVVTGLPEEADILCK